MKHYPHHIGDFDRATRHLSRLERSIYRDLIDLYYDTELQLSLDMTALCRRILARSNEESTAVEQVLNEFFVQTPTGWYHERCESEIEAYRSNNSQKAQAGKASAASKALKRERALNGNPTHVEQPFNSVPTKSNGTPTNHQPSTINHQPINQSTNQPGEGDAQAPVRPSPESVCEAMKTEGMDSVEPSHPELLVLIAKGADIGLFADMARECVKRQKPFSYSLAMVKGRMTDAAAMLKIPMAYPVARNSKPDYSRITEPASPNADAELLRIAADAAIPRNGPPPELVARLALRKSLATPVFALGLDAA